MRDITVTDLLKIFDGPHIDDDILMVDDFRRLPFHKRQPAWSVCSLVCA